MESITMLRYSDWGIESLVCHSLFCLLEFQFNTPLPPPHVVSLSLFLYCCSVLSVGQAVLIMKEQHERRQVNVVGI